MVLNKEILENLHNSGQIPDWAYYQQNGKSIDENYREIVRKHQKRIKEEIEKEIQDKLSDILSDIFDNLEN